jgi:hypothetical protein
MSNKYLLKLLIKEILENIEINKSKIEFNSKINLDLKKYKNNILTHNFEENENESILDINNDAFNYIDFKVQQKNKRKHT